MKRRRKGTWILLLLLLLAALLYGAFRKYAWGKEQALYADQLQIHVLDVGQGDCILLILPSGETMLIDCGPEEASRDLLRHLHRYQIDTIDYAVFTHPHEDHIGSADALFDACEVKRVLMPNVAFDNAEYEELIKAVNGEEGVSAAFAVAGMQASLGELSFTVLGPISSSFKEENDYSIFLRVEYGETAFLFTGDGEAFAEGELLKRYSPEVLKSDLIKIAHHGSRTSSTDAFLDAVSPSYAVISCEAINEYGHPHLEVLDRLQTRNITCMRTDRLGDILILSDGHTLSFPKQTP